MTVVIRNRAHANTIIVNFPNAFIFIPLYSCTILLVPFAFVHFFNAYFVRLQSGFDTNCLARMRRMGWCGRKKHENNNTMNLCSRKKRHRERNSPKKIVEVFARLFLWIIFLIANDSQIRCVVKECMVVREYVFAIH